MHYELWIIIIIIILIIIVLLEFENGKNDDYTNKILFTYQLRGMYDEKKIIILKV